MCVVGATTKSVAKQSLFRYLKRMRRRSCGNESYGGIFALRFSSFWSTVNDTGKALLPFPAGRRMLLPSHTAQNKALKLFMRRTRDLFSSWKCHHQGKSDLIFCSHDCSNDAILAEKRKKNATAIQPPQYSAQVKNQD